MAGKIVADTLEHSTAGSIATNYVVEGSAKFWANFDGTGTASVRDSFNLSSLTDNGTGDFTTSFSSSFGNDDYAVAGSTRTPGVISGGTYQAPRSSASEQATSSLRAYTVSVSSGSLSVADLSFCYPSILGDLA